MWEKTSESETEDDRSMVMEDESLIFIQNLGEKLMLSFISAGILVCLVENVLYESGRWSVYPLVLGQ